LFGSTFPKEDIRVAVKVRYGDDADLDQSTASVFGLASLESITSRVFGIGEKDHRGWFHGFSLKTDRTPTDFHHHEPLPAGEG
jgi:hypothetical protein